MLYHVRFDDGDEREKVPGWVSLQVETYRVDNAQSLYSINLSRILSLKQSTAGRAIQTSLPRKGAALVGRLC